MSQRSLSISKNPILPKYVRVLPDLSHLTVLFFPLLLNSGKYNRSSIESMCVGIHIFIIP